MTQVATLRRTAAQMGRRQDDLAARDRMPAMVEHTTARIRRRPLTPILRTGQDGGTNHVTPVGGIVFNIPWHSLGPLWLRGHQRGAPWWSVVRRCPACLFLIVERLLFSNRLHQRR